jgi:hypothetical protein
MEPDQARTFVNEELRGVRESLDRVGATVEGLIVALEERAAGGEGGASPAARAKANEVLRLLKGTQFQLPVGLLLQELLDGLD